jgi:hypothetical protein
MRGKKRSLKRKPRLNGRSWNSRVEEIFPPSAAQNMMRAEEKGAF